MIHQASDCHAHPALFLLLIPDLPRPFLLRLKAAGGYLWHVDKVAEVGKYNPGQKMFFLTVAFFGAAMVASGLLIWFPAGYSPELLGLMYVLHDMG